MTDRTKTRTRTRKSSPSGAIFSFPLFRFLSFLFLFQLAKSEELNLGRKRPLNGQLSRERFLWSWFFVSCGQQLAVTLMQGRNLAQIWTLAEYKSELKLEFEPEPEPEFKSATTVVVHFHFHFYFSQSISAHLCSN